MKLEDFTNMTYVEIRIELSKLSKDEIIQFCDENDIPCRKYYSKSKLLDDITNQIKSIFIFRRISGK
ncbi:hypothetical protein D3C81_09010 [compost metagenome]